MNFTNEQHEAILDRSSFLAVTAGAGSGKTRVLVERIANILDKKFASLDQILAITFTEKAAAELKDRICKIVKDEAAIMTASIGTFHSFCASILREHSPLAGLDPDFKVMEEHASGILIRQSIKDTILELLERKNEHAIRTVTELDFKDAIGCIEEMMDYRWHVRRMAAECQIGSQNPKSVFLISREDKLRSSILYCFEEAAKRYQIGKGTNLDFQDLEIHALDLLEKDDIRSKYKKKFKYILVDEFQDVNDVQSHLINLIHDKKQNHLTVVGDPKQSIYRFRGANVHEFDNALKNSSKTITLKSNFRSRPSVISFINNFFPDFQPLVAYKEDSGHCVNILPIESSDTSVGIKERRLLEAKKLAEILPSLSGTTACLFNSLKDARIYKNAFAEKGISFVVYGGGGLLESQEIIDILNALRIINDRNDNVALLGLARSPKLGFTDEELFVLVRKDEERPLYEKLKEEPKGKYLKILEENAPLRNISELIRFIGGESENVLLFSSIAKKIEESEKITLPNFLDYINSLRTKEAGISEYPIANSGSVLLMTVHQSKGLEFDNVILCDTIRPRRGGGKKWCFHRGRESKIGFKLVPEENPEAEAIGTELYDELKDIEKEEEQAEKNRLLYVAMTRTKERLIFPIHNDMKRDGDWHKMLTAKCSEMPKFELSGKIDINKLEPADAPKVKIDFAQTGNIFTVSELETLKRSEKEYSERFLLRMPETPLKFYNDDKLSSSVAGDIIHRMIELSGTYPSDELFEAVRVELEVPEVSSKEKEMILAKYDDFLSSPYAKTKCEKEVPFLIKLNDNYINGKLDGLVVDNDGSWEVIDFKTGHDGSLADYDLQMKTYALAVSKKHGPN